MKHIQIILGLLLLASLSTFAQSPRIKLNQITKDTVKGSVLISSPSDSGMVYSRDFYVAYGADTVLILYGDTLGGVGGGFASVLSDGVTVTGDGTTGNELTADTSVLATLRALSDSLALVISSVTADNVTITGDGTVGSPLVVDTSTVVASVGRLLDSLINVRTDLDLKQDQLNGTGFVKATGTTITYDNSTYLTTEVDGDASNELQTLSYNSSTNEITLSDGGGTEDLSNLDLVDSTRINATGDTAFYYQNGVPIGSQAIAGGGGTSFNNISEDGDTVLISDYLKVDTATLYVDATNNRVGIGTSSLSAKLDILGPTNLQYSYDYITSESTIVMGADFVYPNGQTTRTDGVIKEAVFTMPHYDLDEPNVGLFYGISDSANNRNVLIFGDFSATVNGATEIRFGTASSYDDESGSNVRMFINSSGNVGIGTGTSTPGSKLHVYSTTANDVLLVQDNSGTCEAQPTTTGLTWSCSSDERLKTNIRDAESVLNYINGIRIREYNVINTYENALGVIAQEMLENYPELVTMGEDGYYRVSSLGSWTIVKAIQEQQAQIETLQTELDAKSLIIETQQQKITDLESTIQALITRIENLENK